MSFFYDFLDYFKTYDLKSETQITIVFGVGMMIVGNIKLILSDDCEMLIESGGKAIKICGDNLKIKSVAKGEMIIEGNITSVYKDNAYEK